MKPNLIPLADIDKKKIKTFKRLMVLVGLIYDKESTREELINNQIFRKLWNEDISDETINREISRLINSIKIELRLEVSEEKKKGKTFYKIKSTQANKNIIQNELFPIILRRYLYTNLPVFNIHSLIETKIKPAENEFLSMIMILTAIKDNSIVEMEYTSLSYFPYKGFSHKDTYYILPLDLIFRTNEWILLALDIKSQYKDKEAFPVGKRFHIGGIQQFNMLSNEDITNMRTKLERSRTSIRIKDYNEQNTLLKNMENISSNNFKIEHKTIEEIFKDSIGIFVSGQEPIKVKVRFMDKGLIEAIRRRPKLSMWEITEEKDSFILTTEVSSLSEMSDWIFQFGKNALIIEPQELKDILIKRCKEILEKY